MSEEVHFIPVGIDFQILVQPLSKDQFTPDRVILHYSAKTPDREKEAELAENMVNKMESACKNVINAEVEIRPLVDIFDYVNLFQRGYNEIGGEIDEGNEVYINISSMPRTVAFAFATAANTHIAQKPHLRRSIYTYYVSPKEYLVIDAMETLEDHIQFLEDTDLDNFKNWESPIDSLRDISDRLADGITEGVKELPDGFHVKFAAAPVFGIDDIQEEILQILEYNGNEIESISELSREHGRLVGEDGDSARHKKKIRYHVNTNLVPSGLIEKDTSAKRHKISLSRIGEMWTMANDSISESDFSHS